MPPLPLLELDPMRAPLCTLQVSYIDPLPEGVLGITHYKTHYHTTTTTHYKTHYHTTTTTHYKTRYHTTHYKTQHNTYYKTQHNTHYKTHYHNTHYKTHYHTTHTLKQRGVVQVKLS